MAEALPRATELADAAVILAAVKSLPAERRMTAFAIAFDAMARTGGDLEASTGDRGCTGWTATWCAVHGDCTCPRREDGEVEHNEGDRICPLHDDNSTHPSDERDEQ